MQMPSEGAQEIAVYSLRIDRAKLDRLAEIAEKDHRTLAGEFRQMIDERISRDEQNRETA